MLDGRDENKKAARPRSRRSLAVRATERHPIGEYEEELAEIDDLYVNQTAMALQPIRLPKEIYQGLTHKERSEWRGLSPSFKAKIIGGIPDDERTAQTHDMTEDERTIRSTVSDTSSHYEANTNNRNGIMGSHTPSKTTRQQLRSQISAAHPKVLFADKQPLYTKEGNMTKYVGYVNDGKVKSTTTTDRNAKLSNLRMLFRQNAAVFSEIKIKQSWKPRREGLI